MVDTATSESDFDLREVRRRRMSIYLGVSPDNIDRIAPIYSLFLQQLVDLNTRDLPEGASNVPVLVLLDEFARLGKASVIASGDRKSTRLNSSPYCASRMPSSA